MSPVNTQVKGQGEGVAQRKQPDTQRGRTLAQWGLLHLGVVTRLTLTRVKRVAHGGDRCLRPLDTSLVTGVVAAQATPAWQVRRMAAQVGLGGNMRKAVVLAIALLVTSVVLGGTVFRQQVADASALLNVFVTNDSSHPVPVREQNLDANGNIKVHEQGTANVNVTNSSLSVRAPAVTDGAGFVGPAPAQLSGPEQIELCVTSTTKTCTATALVITMTAGVENFRLTLSSGGIAASFVGPAGGGVSNIVLPLSRPITFDSFWCAGHSSSDTCTVSWVGAQP